jgi:ribosome-binding protein aMBF1 (putative translation factor)
VEGVRVDVDSEPDDIDAYVATCSEKERHALATADAAIDIAILLYRAREQRGLSQAAAARRAGLQQQAVSRLERSGANLQLETLRSYLGALGYVVELSVFDLDTGERALTADLAPAARR